MKAAWCSHKISSTIQKDRSEGQKVEKLKWYSDLLKICLFLVNVSKYLYFSWQNILVRYFIRQVETVEQVYICVDFTALYPPRLPILPHPLFKGELGKFISTALAVLFTLVDSGIDVVCMYVCIYYPEIALTVLHC